MTANWGFLEVPWGLTGDILGNTLRNTHKMIGGILWEYLGEFLGNTKGEYSRNTWRNTVEYLGNIQGILWGILREY